MIRDLTLLGQAHPRRQLPAGLLPMLLEAARAGVTEFTVAICDQLAPSQASNDHVLHHASIPTAVRALCHHCPPAQVAAPVITMAPDLADRAQHPPARIAGQWREVIDESAACWRGTPSAAIDRNAFYARLPTAQAVIHTLSEEPYANLLLTLDPSRSAALLGIPRELCAALVQALSLAGHSNCVAIVPLSNAALAHGHAPRALALRYSCSARRLATLVSGMWLPDTHVQHKAMPLKVALGVCTQRPDALEACCASLSGLWREPEHRQHLSVAAWHAEISDPRLIAAIVCEDEGEPAAFLLKNGVSGADGGF
jgi:L-fucose mutarotase/ribose pyranase (RbsD/FucU family)